MNKLFKRLISFFLAPPLSKEQLAEIKKEADEIARESGINPYYIERELIRERDGTYEGLMMIYGGIIILVLVAIAQAIKN